MNTSTLTRERKIARLHPAIHTLEGDGFEVRCAILSSAFEAVGRFIFMDHFGPIEIRPAIRSTHRSCAMVRSSWTPLPNWSVPSATITRAAWGRSDLLRRDDSHHQNSH
jgi:hypothetical protein